MGLNGGTILGKLLESVGVKRYGPGTSIDELTGSMVKNTPNSSLD